MCILPYQYVEMGWLVMLKRWGACRRANFYPLLVGIVLPTIEVRFEHLKADAEVHVGSRGLPTIQNSVTNIFEV